eukprot:4275227-Pleurochrysis_carterae.AAC.2
MAFKVTPYALPQILRCQSAMEAGMAAPSDDAANAVVSPGPMRHFSGRARRNIIQNFPDDQGERAKKAAKLVLRGEMRSVMRLGRSMAAQGRTLIG